MSADDWAARSLEVLKDEGIGAVQINRLCAEFGVTRGSFYWHFADLDALKEAIAARWCAETRTALEALSDLAPAPPARAPAGDDAAPDRRHLLVASSGRCASGPGPTATSPT